MSTDEPSNKSLQWTGYRCAVAIAHSSWHQRFPVQVGTTNLIFNTNSQYLFTRTIQTTDTYETFRRAPC